MFFIVWRGSGLVVAVVIFIAIVLTIPLTYALAATGVNDGWTTETALQITFMAAALFTAYAAHYMGGSRKKTIKGIHGDRQVVVKGDAGSLYGIPTRFWPFIIVALGLILACALGADDHTLQSPFLKSQSVQTR